jgi:hypothetical protein
MTISPSREVDKHGTSILFDYSKDFYAGFGYCHLIRRRVNKL